MVFIISILSNIFVFLANLIPTLISFFQKTSVLAAATLHAARSEYFLNCHASQLGVSQQFANGKWVCTHTGQTNCLGLHAIGEQFQHLLESNWAPLVEEWQDYRYCAEELWNQSLLASSESFSITPLVLADLLMKDGSFLYSLGHSAGNFSIFKHFFSESIHAFLHLLPSQ